MQGRIQTIRGNALWWDLADNMVDLGSVSCRTQWK